MARIKIIDRADMDAEQARVYDDAINSGGVVGGPYYAFIRMPKLFEAAQNLRTCLRSGPLSVREGQIVNLVVARFWNAKYPWSAQARRALEAGVTQATIDTINAGETPELTDPRDQACFSVPKEILENKGLSDEGYAEAEKVLGLNDLIAVIAITGNFSMTCLGTNAFQIDPPDNDPTPLID